MDHDRRLRNWALVAVLAALALAFVGGLAAASTDVQAWPLWLKSVVWTATALLFLLVLVAEQRRGRLPPGPVGEAVAQGRAGMVPWRRGRAEAIVRRAMVEDGFTDLADLHEQIHAVVGGDRRAAERLIRSVVSMARTVRRYDLAADAAAQLRIYDVLRSGGGDHGHAEQKALLGAAKRLTPAELLGGSPLAVKPLLHALVIGLGMAVNVTNTIPQTREDLLAVVEAREESGWLVGVIETLREQARGASPEVAVMADDELSYADPWMAPVMERIADTVPGHPDVCNLMQCADTLKGYRAVRGRV